MSEFQEKMLDLQRRQTEAAECAARAAERVANRPSKIPFGQKVDQFFNDLYWSFRWNP